MSEQKKADERIASRRRLLLAGTALETKRPSADHP
jgi:hypothetical protein